MTTLTDPMFIDKLEFPHFTLRVTMPSATTPVATPAPGQTLTAVPAANRLSISILKMAEDEKQEFASVRDFYLATFHTKEVTEGGQVPQAMAVLHECNRIAALARRGAGNTLVAPVNPSYDLDGIVQHVEANITSEKPTLHQSSGLEPNELLVFYQNKDNGFLDGPAHAVVNADGSVTALLTAYMARSLGNHADYGVLLRFA